MITSELLENGLKNLDGTWKALSTYIPPPLYLYTNDFDFVIAENEREALEIAKIQGHASEEELGEFELYEKEFFTLHYEEKVDEQYEEKDETFTIPQLIEKFGKGYIASTEY